MISCLPVGLDLPLTLLLLHRRGADMPTTCSTPPSRVSPEPLQEIAWQNRWTDAPIQRRVSVHPLRLSARDRAKRSLFP